MNQLISKLNQGQMNRRLNFNVGDTVKVHYIISVDSKTNQPKTQVFEGAVIGIANKESSKTFTVRRVSYDVGVERIFPLYSTKIAKIELVRKGNIHQAKLYYLRDLSGKSAKIKERKGGQAIVANVKKQMLDDEKKSKEAMNIPSEEQAQSN